MRNLEETSELFESWLTSDNVCQFWPSPSGPKGGDQFLLSVDIDYISFQDFTDLNEFPEDIFAQSESMTPLLTSIMVWEQEDWTI